MRGSNPPNTVVLVVPIIILSLALAISPLVHAQASSFTLTATPSNLCVNPGVDAVAVIGVQSVGQFVGTVDLSDRVDPAVTNGPTLSAIPSSETLAAGQTVTFNLAISTTTSTPLYTYTITVSGFSGGSLQQAIVQLTVAAGCSVGGRALTVNPSTLLSSNTGLAILAGAILALGATLLTYYANNKRTKIRPI
jgi:hypothetical protein